MSSPLRRTLEWFGFAREETPGGGVQPPSRPKGRSHVSRDRALTLSTVYRGIGIHATAACQLSMDVWRGSLTMPSTPALVLRPDLNQSRSAFYEYTVVSLFTDGNAFWRTTRADASSTRPGEVINLKPLDPREVGVLVNRDTDVVTFNYRGETLTTRDIVHLKFLRVPGRDRGLGPIQAAQEELAGAIDARDYGSSWFSEGGQPDGVLTTDQELAPGDTTKYKNVWYGRNPDGSPVEDQEQRLSERLRVMGKGLTYSPIFLKPSEVQFLESQQFSTTQIARLLGLPASLLLAAVEGNSQTYSNVEQDWIAYVRFSLMLPLREIEEAFSDLLPRGQVARFNLSTLLRTDTKTRYEGYQIGLDPVKGWLVDDEVRGWEGLAPLTDAQRAARTANVPKKEPANATN
jgi:HK97 family phage portal protein